jgi:hypothetical protein
MESKATLAVSKRKLKQERGSAKIRPCGLRRTRAHTSRARSLIARQHSSHADQMTLWHALTHIGASEFRRVFDTIPHGRLALFHGLGPWLPPPIFGQISSNPQPSTHA